MKRAGKLTTAEIHFLTVLLTGELNEHRDVKVAKFRTPNEGLSVTMPSGRRPMQKIDPRIIERLLSLGLIYLKPLSIPKFRHVYEGEWAINKHVFKKHPQYNEVRAHAALGT